MDDSTGKIRAWQNLAELFLKEDKKVFIVDYNGDYYFADILLVGERMISIQCFAPIDRKGRKFNLYWISIKRFLEYQKEDGGKRDETDL